MKNFLLLMMLLTTTISAKAQQTSYLRFRHIGDETKPVGTLTICIKETVAPLDSGLNSQFGKTVITDKFTYRNIKRFINVSKKVIYNKKELSFRNGTFQILIQDKPYGYLNYDKSNSFFRNLIQYLKEKECDKKVIDLLDAYTD